MVIYSFHSVHSESIINGSFKHAVKEESKKVNSAEQSKAEQASAAVRVVNRKRKKGQGSGEHKKKVKSESGWKKTKWCGACAESGA